MIIKRKIAIGSRPTSLEFGELATDGHSVYLGTNSCMGDGLGNVAQVTLTRPHPDAHCGRTCEGVFDTPVGAIIAVMPGYFQGAGNADYCGIAGACEWMACHHLEWAPCNGCECCDPSSPIFNMSGRYLPNITNCRFISGGAIKLQCTFGGGHLSTTTGCLMSENFSPPVGGSCSANSCHRHGRGDGATSIGAALWISPDLDSETCMQTQAFTTSFASNCQSCYNFCKPHQFSITPITRESMEVQGMSCYHSHPHRHEIMECGEMYPKYMNAVFFVKIR